MFDDPSEKRKLHSEGIAELRGLWIEAVADDSDGLDPEPVMDALERKYLALADEKHVGYHA